MLAVWNKKKSEQPAQQAQASLPRKEWTGKIGAGADESAAAEQKPPTPESEMRRDLIPERYFSQELKEKVEMNTIESCGDREQILYEQRWSKTSKEDVAQIESRIDAMFRGIPEKPKERRAAPHEERAQFEPPSYVPASSYMAPPPWIDLPITGTIIDKRVLYRTAGGYIVEVVYRAPDGMLKTDRFSVTSVGDVEYTLDKLRQSIPAPAQVPQPQAPQQPIVAEEQAAKAAPPAQAPEQKPTKPEEKKEAAPPEEKGQAQPAPAKKKGLDIGGMVGGIAGKLPFGKKKEQK
ncbi:MAG: hypothetical protein CVT47_01160 [Thermoplasmata archaeon HGW-Thermoplasmata-2]|nr:MAG: hypothetical protein CVT47_01160 [Thermoplasmata archaeon HGW-Thermoplasmata-2]